MATTPLNFEDNPLLDRLPGLLRDHDYLHDEVVAVDETVDPARQAAHDHTPEEVEVNTQIKANVQSLAAILGIKGVYGLLHLCDEVLVELGRDGIDLGDPDEVQAFANAIEIPTAITQSLAVIAAFDGTIPDDDELIQAKLDELVEGSVAVIQLG